MIIRINIIEPQMIRKIQKIDYLQLFKLKVFSTQINILKSEKPFSPIFYLIFSFIAFFPLVSIMFLADPFLPSQINTFFKVFLFTEIPLIFDFPQTYITYSVVSFMTFMTILFIFIVCKNSFGLFTWIFSYCLSFFIFFIVPFTHYFLKMCIKIEENNFQTMIELILSCLSVIQVPLFIVISSTYIFFRINPFRKKNLGCNYNSIGSFYGFLLDISRVFILTLDSPPPVFPIISLVLEFYKRGIKSGKINSTMKAIEGNTSNLVVITHVSVIFTIVTGLKFLGFSLFCVLLVCSIMKGLLEYISSTHSRSLPLCQRDVEEYYDYYYELMEKMKRFSSSGEEDNIYKNFFQHGLICQEERCDVRQILKKNKEKIYLQNLCFLTGEIISKNSKKSPENEIIYDLWNYEQGKTNVIKRRIRNYSLIHEFIVEFIFQKLSFENYEHELENNDQDKSSSEIFEKELYNALVGLSLFYGELNKLKPHFEVIIQNMGKVKKHTQNAKSVFKLLLKNQELNSNIISVYFSYCNYFLNPDFLSSSLRLKIQNFRMKESNDHIHDLPIPAILINYEGTFIEDMNVQALKYVRIRKGEIMRSLMFEFFVPPLNIAYSTRKAQENDEKSFLFFKKQNSTKEPCFGKVDIEKKNFNNTQYIIMKINKKITNPKHLEILINDKFKMVGCNYNNVNIKVQGKVVPISVTDIFNQYIIPHQTQIEETNFIKIQINECLEGFLVLKESIIENHRILSLKISSNSQRERTKTRSSFRLSEIGNTSMPQKPSTFKFCYDFQKNKEIVLIGSIETKKKSNHMKKTLEMKTLNESLLQKLISNTIKIEKANLGEGIKSYRLYEGEMYNIDLEDKEKYNELFAETMESKVEKESENKIEINEIFYFISIICVCIFLFAIAYTLIEITNERKEELNELFIKRQEFDIFSLDFNRILSIMRDVKNGLYAKYNRNFIADIDDSYNKIQQRKNKKIFSDHRILMIYKNQTYEGSLNELTEIILSYTHEFMVSNDQQTIDALFDSTTHYLNQEIKRQEDELHNKTENILDEFQKLKNIYFICIIIGAVLFYLLLFCLLWKSSNKIKKNLKEVLLLSDSESKARQEIAQRFKIVLVDLKKNSDDLETIFSAQKVKRPERLKPKESILGNQTLICFFAVFISFLLSYFLITLIYKIITSQTINEISTIIKQGESISRNFIEFSRAANTIYHTGQVNETIIHYLDESLSIIDRERFSLKFQESFNEQLVTFFFKDSCDMVIQKGYLNSTQSCETLFSGFQLQNPLFLGASIYLRRQNFHLISKLEETFAITGIFSQVYRNIYRQFILQIEEEGLHFIEEMFGVIYVLNQMLLLLNGLYLLLSIIIFWFLKTKIEQIQDYIHFLNFQIEREAKSQEEMKQKKEFDKVEEEVQLLADQKHSQNL